MPSRKGWIFTGVLRIGKSGFRSNKSYGQTWRGWVKGNLRNTRTNLCGSCPFSRAVIGMLESKGGCELPRGSTWVTVGESVNRWHGRLGKYHGFLHSISTCEASGRIPGNTPPPFPWMGNAGTSQPISGRHQWDSRFKVKLWNTLGMNQKNQPHICLFKKNVLLGLAVKIFWVNAGIYRVSFLVALMGFKIFNS